MKTLYQIMLGSILLFSLSCKKDITQSPSPNEDNKIASINAYLTKLQNPNQPNRSNNIETLKAHLNYSAMHEEEDIRGSSLVIPIDDDFRSFAKFSDESILNLVASLNKDGSIRNVHVVAYTPTKNIHISKLPQNTFHNILHTAKDITDGRYLFLSPAGTKQYELEYKGGSLVASGEFTINPGKGAVATNGVRTNATCINWYLVTTYYDSYGNIVGQSSEYVGTTCDGCDNLSYQSLCSTGDGGSGTPAGYHYAKNYTRTWLVVNLNDLGIYKTNTFTIEDDYFITGIGFGAISKSNTDPTEAIVKQVEAYAEINANGYTEAYTRCTPKIAYPSDPNSFTILQAGSRNWNVPQIKNP